ncbi:50S ribosomal protein L22 [Flammeovirga pectinis]|uniref:Large ribosomal subunit protein uL22 n=1 Tax=Flammeovirga pectinis TaxID=2494373 RepID=A0A3Q9FM89_9BACT|nr:50S ribosomal protein L22 [Flammeovirga pectinis]AZQ63363.1 50S ribosomal protein L22 [Flammeovirga pectinis]
MEAVAKLNNCPIAPRKMMLVADAVRGVQVIDALNTLRYAQKAGAPLVEKLILSAVANWENKNPDESVEDADLYVKSIFVTGGRQLKRFRPAPQGRAHRIRKRSNHVTVVIDARSTSLIDVVSEGSSESNESDN